MSPKAPFPPRSWTGWQRPLLFLGGQRWTPAAAAAITEFAETNGIPVVQDWHAADHIPSSSPVNAGWLGYGRHGVTASMFEQADVLVAVGAVPTDVPTDGFTLRQDLSAVNILVTIDSTLRGRSGAVTEYLLASPVAFAEAVTGLQLGRSADWSSWLEPGRAAQVAQSTIPPLAELPNTAPGTAHMSTVMAELLKNLPADIVSTFGAGNHCAWAQYYLPTDVFPSQLGTRNGSMGYSIPAAVAASKADPERLVVAVCGDGEFLMNGQELATAAQFNAPLLAIIMDNGQYGTIRSHQEAQFPGRISGTQLSNPDFAALARAYGGHGETVSSDEQAAEAVQRAVKAVTADRIPAVIHVLADANIVVP